MVPGRHILDRDVGLLQELADDLEPARRFQVQGHRLLVGIELVEIPWVVGMTRLQPSARVTGARIFDLDHFSPSQASASVHEGPASNWVKSTTRMPLRQSSSTPMPIADLSRCDDMPIIMLIFTARATHATLNITCC